MESEQPNQNPEASQPHSDPEIPPYSQPTDIRKPKRPIEITIIGIAYVILGVYVWLNHDVRIPASMDASEMPYEILAISYLFADYVLYFLVAYVLFYWTKRARTTTMVISIIGLFVMFLSMKVIIPPENIVGIILNVALLYYMWRPHIKAYFVTISKTVPTHQKNSAK